MKSKFSKLALNKKTIAKLNDQQLSTIKGGKSDPPVDGDCTTTSPTCNDNATTKAN